jgi:predicted HAD superfamily Cof-like phosphohydrolase
MSLTNLTVQVREFHKAFGHPAPDAPVMQDALRVHKRTDWIVEEVNELRDAKTIVDQADAYIDMIYFAVGGLVELGLDPGPLWDIVHNANMAKLGADGKPLYHPDGKVRKPEGWVAPEPLLHLEVQRQINESA